MRQSSCFSFTYSRLFSIYFDLKKAGKVREVVEQSEEIGILPMRIFPESFFFFFELQIDLASCVALLPN